MTCWACRMLEAGFELDTKFHACKGSSDNLLEKTMALAAEFGEIHFVNGIVYVELPDGTKWAFTPPLPEDI